MKNISLKQKGHLLTITVDLSKEFGDSRSGKTNLIATTAGNVRLPGFEDDGVFLGLTLFQWKDNEPIKNRFKKDPIKRVRVKLKE